MSLITNFKSQVIAVETFSRAQFDLQKDLLIVDKNVLAVAPELREGWKFVYEVNGGETLKDFAQFSSHVEEILKVWQIPIGRQSRIVACGGGSVGDFAGFFASVLKRGVAFEQCPSTWLAAIDSAHGGKTALNVHGIKNQLGTFYPAQKVFLVKDLLLAQPEERATEGLGELVKIALIDKGGLFAALSDHPTESAAEVLWRHLQNAIAIKYEIILQDPYETEGVRKILNLGHTLGHVLESYFSRSHGESVMQGLWFALEWSSHKGFLAHDTWMKIQSVFKHLNLECWTTAPNFIPMDYKRAAQFLQYDKKLTEADKFDFVFLRNIGQPFLESVFIDEILLEGTRQGWVHG